MHPHMLIWVGLTPTQVPPSFPKRNVKTGLWRWHSSCVFPTISQNESDNLRMDAAHNIKGRSQILSPVWKEMRFFSSAVKMSASPFHHRSTYLLFKSHFYLVWIQSWATDSCWSFQRRGRKVNEKIRCSWLPRAPSAMTFPSPGPQRQTSVCIITFKNERMCLSGKLLKICLYGPFSSLSSPVASLPHPAVEEAPTSD